MKNHIIDWLEKEKLGWQTSVAKQVGLIFVNTLSDALWCLDGNGRTLADRSLGIPSLLCQFQGYKQPEKYKHRKVLVESLKAIDLQTHSVALLTLCTSSYMQTKRWEVVHDAIHSLGTNLQQYAAYLNSQKEAAKENCSRMVNQTEVDEMVVLVAAKDIHPSTHYQTLHRAIEKKTPFEPVFVNEYAPPDARRRYEYIKGLIVPCKCVKYTYYSGTQKPSTLLVENSIGFY